MLAGPALPAPLVFSQRVQENLRNTKGHRVKSATLKEELAVPRLHLENPVLQARWDQSRVGLETGTF